MKKATGNFTKVPEYISVCEECEKELNPINFYTYNFEWNDGYDAYGEDWDFCSMDCLIKHIKDYIKDDGLYYTFPGGETVKLIIPSEAMKKLLFGE